MAKIEGIDYSSNAIEYAKMIENDDLSFSIMDINELNILKDKYSKIILIDSIYFSNNYEKTLLEIYEKVQLNGKIGIFYSDFIFDAKNQIDIIQGDDTIIAKIFREKNWKYQFFDFTKEHYDLMKRKNIVSNKLKEDFLNENNEKLYIRLNEESIVQGVKFSDFVKFSNRYFYCIEKIL